METEKKRSVEDKRLDKRNKQLISLSIVPTQMKLVNKQTIEAGKALEAKCRANQVEYKQEDYIDRSALLLIRASLQADGHENAIDCLEWEPKIFWERVEVANESIQISYTQENADKLRELRLNLTEPADLDTRNSIASSKITPTLTKSRVHFLRA